MQQNFSSNRSHLIKVTEIQKKKAKRRLIGSIFLLVIALAVLLYVIANIEPIPVRPKIIEIKSTASNVIQNNFNNASATKAIASSIIASAPVEQVIASAPINEASQVVKVIASQTETNNTNASSPLAILKPRIVTDTVKTKSTPEDILNGIDSSSKPEATRYYVQLLGSDDKPKLLKLQATLKDKGINTSMQTVDTPNGKVYRLRIGPFTNKDAADKKLNLIKSEM